MEGESGDWTELTFVGPGSEAMRWAIIFSNFSMKRSFVSLACRMYDSRVVSLGIGDRSIELTALYKEASVVGYGALKYSSSANNNKGYGNDQLGSSRLNETRVLPCRYAEMNAEYK